MSTKTPEEIKNALRLCSIWEKNCEECPYKPMKRALSCSAEMKRDSLAYIEQIEKRTSLNTLRDAIYEDAVAHGLWERTDYIVDCCMKRAYLFEFPFDRDSKLRALAAEVVYVEANELVQSAEAGEYAEELADVIIASLSVAGKLGIDIDAAVRRKMEINKARPWKHGKDEKK